MCYSIEESENKIEQGELVMDLSYMQREAMDIAIGRLFHCGGLMQGDFGNDTYRPLVIARSLLLDLLWLGKCLSRALNAPLPQLSNRRLLHKYGKILHNLD